LIAGHLLVNPIESFSSVKNSQSVCKDVLRPRKISYGTLSRRFSVAVEEETKAEEETSKIILGKAIPYSDLTVGILKETYPGENRVSQSPESVKSLTKAGFKVVIEEGAGEKASFYDDDYEDAGAKIVSHEEVFKISDILTKIRPPSESEIPKLASKTLIGMISPAINSKLFEDLSKQNTNVFALDCVPRMLSRAQSYDVLSSQANIAGYRAIIEAAEQFPRFFAGQMTAAGKVPPAKVLVVSFANIHIL